jgi:hypothetical protein
LAIKYINYSEIISKFHHFMNYSVSFCFQDGIITEFLGLDIDYQVMNLIWTLIKIHLNQDDKWANSLTHHLYQLNFHNNPKYSIFRSHAVSDWISGYDSENRMCNLVKDLTYLWISKYLRFWVNILFFFMLLINFSINNQTIKESLLLLWDQSA